MSDNKLRLLLGLPIAVPNLCYVHPVKIRDIADIGEDKFNQYLSIITFQGKDRIEIEDLNLSTFEFVTISCIGDIGFRNSYLNALSFFLREEVHLTNDGLFYLGDINEQRIIKEEHYEQIRQIVKEQNYMDKEEKKENQFKPHDERTRQLLEKQKKYEALLQQANAENGLHLHDIVEIVAAYSNVDILRIYDLTIYQLYKNYIRLSLKANYTDQYSALLQGADIKQGDLKHYLGKSKY